MRLAGTRRAAAVTIINNLEAMLTKGQDNALLRYGLGNEYLKARQLEKAIEHLNKATELDPHYSAAWKQLGRALTENGQAQKAIAAYQSGIGVAEERGDIQAAKEMQVFLRRVKKQQQER